jgi:hypothetical protein
MMAIELIHATQVKQRFGLVPDPFNVSPKWVGIKREHQEQLRIIRTYATREGFAKDFVFHTNKAWPTSKTKASWYVGCRVIQNYNPLSGIVWC